MGYELEENKPVRGTKKHLDAMAKLDASKTDINSLSLVSIVWHLILRYKKVWFWLGLVGVGYVLGFLGVGL